MLLNIDTTKIRCTPRYTKLSCQHGKCSRFSSTFMKKGKWKRNEYALKRKQPKYTKTKEDELNNSSFKNTAAHHEILGARGVARAVKVGATNEGSLATPSTSLKICHYPLPTTIFSSILRKLPPNPRRPRHC